MFPDRCRVHSDVERFESVVYETWKRVARGAMNKRESALEEVAGIETFVEYIAPEPRLLIAGAGHDAVPLLRFSKELG